MNGVEVLASNEVVVEHIYNFKVFWIVFIAASLFLIIITNVGITGIKTFIINSIISILLALIFGMFSGVIFEKPSEYETQYKVVISDEVLLNEFNKNYEIISQEGKIYTVREKN